MYIFIKGFRSVNQYEAEFQNESITLLSGPSGIGKSTLMNAIFWCIYGTLKNVRKFGIKSGQCMVKLEIGSIQITRSKSPESLVLIINGCTYSDKEAQDKIESLFGTSNIWLASCYLRQGTRNKFLESSPSERLDILSEICFSACNPEQDIEKIDLKLKETTKDFELKNQFYKRDLDLFQKKRKEYPNYKQDVLSEEQKIYLGAILMSNDNISELEARLSCAERLESSYISLLETRNQWVSGFENYNEFLLSDGDKVELTRFINIDLSEMQKCIELIESEIQNLEKTKIIYKSHDEQIRTLLNDYNIPYSDLKSIVDSMLPIDKYREICQQYQLLPKQIQKEENRLNISELQKNTLKSLMDQLVTLESEFKTIRSPEVIQELFEQLCERVTCIQNLLEQKKKLETKIKYIQSVQSILDDDTIEARNVEHQEIKNAIIREKIEQEKSNFLTTLSIQNEKSCIEKAIHIRKKLCQLQPLFQDVSVLQELEEKIMQIQQKIDMLGKKNWILVNDLPKRMIELTTAQASLSCPKCSTLLRFENNHLSECKVQIPKDKLDALEKLITDSKQRIEWIDEKDKLEEDLNEKANLFEKSCEEIGITSEELFQYPKLEQSDKDKLIQETLKLESYLSYSDEFVSPDRLELCKTKWDAIKIKEECLELESVTKVLENVNIVELENQKEQLTEERTKQKIMYDNIQQIKKKISQIEIDECMDQEQIQALKNRLETIRIEIEKHEKHKQLETIYQKIQDVDLLEVENKIMERKVCMQGKKNEMEETRRRMIEMQHKLNLCEKAERIYELDEKLKGKYEDPNSVRLELANARSKVEEAKEKLQKMKEAEEMVNQRNLLENQRKELIHLSNRVGAISKLRSIANELEHKRMNSILETINDFANEILTILFDDPMKIEFMIYKTSKTKDKVKPSIVYKLLYKGNEIDNVDQLSGGEGDRVSLAVTCALFQFSKFPFLLLDEFASSLDLNTKESAVKSLKTFLGIGGNQSKSILCISHDSVEGIYDYVVHCSSLVNKN